MDITITSMATTTNETMWRAATDGLEVICKTAGEALDSIRKRLGTEQNDMFLVRQQWQPDEFFTAAQQQRLGELMESWRAARDSGKKLSENEQAELEALVDAQLEGSANRAAAMRQNQNNRLLVLSRWR